MSILDADRRATGDAVRIRALHVALAASLALHALLLVMRAPLPALPPSPDHQGKGAMTGQLRAQLATPPAPARPPAAAPTEPRPPAREAPPPRARSAERPPAVAPRPPPTPPPSPPPVLSGSGAARPPATPPPRAADAPVDMAALVEARRRARQGPSSAAEEAAVPPVPADDESARRERAVAANLGSLKAPSPGENQRRGGGVFQLRRLGTEEAAFLFFGWNRAMGRNNTQQIEVRRGTNPNIELAVVRRMIAIIREYESGDFLWESQRLGRGVTLSARAADNASLEAFMLREFF